MISRTSIPECESEQNDEEEIGRFVTVFDSFIAFGWRVFQLTYCDIICTTLVKGVTRKIRRYIFIVAHNCIVKVKLHSCVLGKQKH